MGKLRKLSLLLAFLVGAGWIWHNREAYKYNPAKSVETIKETAKNKEKLMDKIKEFGKDWKSHNHYKSDEEFFKEMLKKATYNQIKLRHKYVDGVSKEIYFPKGMIKESEMIPDQVQAALNLHDVLIIFCDKDKEGTLFYEPSSGWPSAAYYHEMDKNIFISVPHSNRGLLGSTILHELGHAFQDIIEKKFRINYHYLFDEIYNKYIGKTPIHTKNKKEFFAFMFENYYGFYYGRNEKKEYFKEWYSEAYSFIKKLEALVIERSLKENWIKESIEKHESDKRNGVRRWGKHNKWKGDTFLD